MKTFTLRSLLFYSGLLFTLLIIGQYNTINAQSKHKPKTSKTLLIFEKQPCFGFCPVYKATFQKNGTVLVTYHQPEKPEVNTSFKLSEKEVSSLWKRGVDVGFFKMKDRYETLRTDFPGRELTLYKNNKPKKVIYTEGGTPEFDAYLAELAAIVEGKLNVNFGPPTAE